MQKQWKIQLGGCHLDDIGIFHSLNYLGSLLGKSYTLKWSVDLSFAGLCFGLTESFTQARALSALPSRYPCVLQTWTLSSVLITPSLPPWWFKPPRGKQSQRRERSKQREHLGNTHELPVLLFIHLTHLWTTEIISRWHTRYGEVRCHDSCLSYRPNQLPRFWICHCFVILAP